MEVAVRSKCNNKSFQADAPAGDALDEVIKFCQGIPHALAMCGAAVRRFPNEQGTWEELLRALRTTLQSVGAETHDNILLACAAVCVESLRLGSSSEQLAYSAVDNLHSLTTKWIDQTTSLKRYVNIMMYLM